MLVIKNGNVLVEDTLKKVDILIDEGKIVNIAENIEGDHETIDASGLTVLPGLVDVHVHLREPGHAQKETIKTGTGLQSSDPQTGYSGFSDQNCTGTSGLPVTPGTGKI